MFLLFLGPAKNGPTLNPSKNAGIFMQTRYTLFVELPLGNVSLIVSFHFSFNDHAGS